MDTLLKDIRYAVRQLFRSPGFSAVVVLTLALGIGANSMLFSIVNAALLQPLPYPHAERLVSLSLATPDRDMEVMSASGAQSLSEGTRTLTAITTYARDHTSITGAGPAKRIAGADVSEEFFRVMGVQPELGGGFSSEDFRTDGSAVVLLGHEIWMRDFAGDPGIVGRTVKLEGRSHTVVGVMPPKFSFPDEAEFWLPLPRRPVIEGAIFYQYAVGRLRPEFSISEAQTELSDLLRTRDPDLRRLVPEARLVVMPLHERMYGDLRPTLLILFGTVFCVLLIACANVANLLLARANSRRKEFAVRVALGASRARLVRQLLVESLLLALLGGATGLLLPLYGLQLLVALGPESLARIPEIAVSGPVVGFTLAISLGTALLFGLAPALALSRSDVQGALKAGEPRTGGDRRMNRSRRLLVMAQLASAVVLVVGAGLLAKSFVRLRSIDWGFRADGVLQARLSLPHLSFPDSASQETFFQAMLERVRALPGVESATLTPVRPMGGFDRTLSLSTSNSTSGPDRKVDIAVYGVGAEYFHTFGIPLRAGRAFANTDRIGTPPVAVISEAAARILLPGKSAVGERLDLSSGGVFTVVGVVPDVVQRAAEVEPLPTVYTPLLQSGSSSRPSRVIALRTGLDPRSYVSGLQRIVRSMDPELPLSDIATMDQVLAKSVAPARFNALLLGVFATLALTLAAFGLYGLIAYTVVQRTREIGVRMALGAETGDVLALFIRQGLMVTAGGIGIGLISASALSRLLTTLLFQVDSTDPGIYLLTPIVLIAVSALATILPARRATQVDPVVALRAE